MRDKDGFIVPVDMIAKFYFTLNADNQFVAMLRHVKTMQPFTKHSQVSVREFSASLVFLTDEEGAIKDSSRTFEKIRRVERIDAITGCNETLFIQDLAGDLRPSRLWNNESGNAKTFLISDKKVSFDLMLAKMDNNMDY